MAEQCEMLVGCRNTQLRFHHQKFLQRKWSAPWWLSHCLYKHLIRYEAEMDFFFKFNRFFFTLFGTVNGDKKWKRKKCYTFLSVLATVDSATWSRVLAGITPNSSDARIRRSSFLNSNTYWKKKLQFIIFVPVFKRFLYFEYFSIKRNKIFQYKVNSLGMFFIDFCIRLILW